MWDPLIKFSNLHPKIRSMGVYKSVKFCDLSHVASKIVTIWMGFIYEIGRFCDHSHYASKKVAI